jgi:hypothetical protein
MEGDIDTIEMLFKKQKELKRKKFILRIKESRTFLAIIMLAIGISWTVVYYEGQALYRDAQILFAPRTLTLVNPVLASEMPKVEKIEEIKPVEVIKNESDQITTIKKVAKEQNIDWKLVYAVCLKESGCKIPDCDNVVGACDGHESMGYFQINKPAHPDITEAQANDLAWSANWTIQHGAKYKDNPALFFKNHNGIGKTTNQWYVDGALEIFNKL